MHHLLKNFLLILFLLFVCFFIGNAEAVNCKRHPIYCHIKKVKPKMNNKKAMRLSNLMYKYARKYKIKNPILSVAIAMQETRLRNINRVQTVIVFEEVCIREIDSRYWKPYLSCKEVPKFVVGYSDISIFQFHALTIRRYGLDAVKLKNNLEYAVDKHFMIMKDKLKLCKYLGNEAWTCYHSRTPKLRKRYKEDVERYL